MYQPDPNIDPAERQEPRGGAALAGCAYCGDPTPANRAYCTDRCEGDFRRMARAARATDADEA